MGAQPGKEQTMLKTIYKCILIGAWGKY